ncbi:MAG: hypothetical protein HY516_00615 [Candidatus Aenigmarchaeota archaeon]|nr:hypothetical protein [Candidatus Aenigmarchaeota archaeon]
MGKKGVSEYNIAVFMSLIIGVVLLAFMILWVKGSEEKQQRERNTVLAAAGCLENNVCEKQAFNKACIHTTDQKNECGCRAWLGVESNEDCGAGKICKSLGGTNYGSCV